MSNILLVERFFDPGAHMIYLATLETHIISNDCIRPIDEDAASDHLWGQIGDHMTLVNIADSYFDMRHRTDRTMWAHLVYQDGLAMGPHVDVNPHVDGVFTTVIVYLTDDYKGGELRLLSGFCRKMSAGDVVMFPSDEMHESLPQSGGNKAVAVVQLERQPPPRGELD